MSDLLLLAGVALCLLSVVLAVVQLLQTQPPRAAILALLGGIVLLFAGAWMDPEPFSPADMALPSRAFTLMKEMKMPKMKTKSAAKKRFSMTASGKVKAGPAGKRHGMIKRSTKFIRDVTGTMILSEPDAKIVKKYMPYNR